MGTIVTVGLAFMLGLAGCSGDAQPEDVASETVRAASALTEFPPEIGIAQAILVQDCVKRAGFDMPFDSSAAQTSPLSFGLSNIFTSPDEARRLGYASTIIDGGDVLSEWEDALTATDREKYFRALLGPQEAAQVEIELSNGMVIATSKEGCIAEAQAELYGSVEAQLAFNGLVNEYLSAASDTGNDRDARLAPLVPDFRRCMQEQGYDVENLGVQMLADELFGKYRAPGDAPGKAEQELAVADFQCQEQIDLRGVVAESFAQGAAEWINANEGKLLAMQEELTSVKDRAVQIING